MCYYYRIRLTSDSVFLQGVEQGVIEVSLHKIHLKSELINGPVIVGIRPSLPIKGVSLLLGNDLADGRVIAAPIVSNKAYINDASEIEDQDLYPACAVTRAKTKKQIDSDKKLNISPSGDLLKLNETFMAHQGSQ